MVYVQRDENGCLLRVEQEPFPEMTGELAYESDELKAWLKAQEEVKSRLTQLQSTDGDLARVLEDLIAVLINRGVIQFTDLPEAARQKLDQRAMTRADIEGLADRLYRSQANTF